MIRILVAFIASFAGVSVQNVLLPLPQTENGPAILGILAQRQSTNAFDSRALTEQDLANLLWGAMGQHRDIVATHQDFVKSASASRVLVMDMDKFGGTEPRQIWLLASGNDSSGIGMRRGEGASLWFFLSRR